MKTMSLVVSILLLTALLTLPGAQAQKAAQTGTQRGQTEIKALDCWGAPTEVAIVRIKLLGTYITYVKPGGRAERSGLRPKDVIVKINHRNTTNPAVLNSILDMFSNTVKRIEYFRPIGNHNDLQQVVINEGQGWTNVGKDLTGTSRGTGGSHLTQAEMESYMIKLINEDRAQNNVSGSLKPSTGLSRMARSYADDMAKRDFRGHKDPEGRGPRERAKLAGLSIVSIAENCAYPGPQPNSYDMVKTGEAQLMESDVHRKSILESSAMCVGVGIAYSKNGGLKVVQIFSDEDVP